jgi:hypothetical protein
VGVQKPNIAKSSSKSYSNLQKKVLCQVLGSIPNIGEDSDFERMQEDNTAHDVLA